VRSDCLLDRGFFAWAQIETARVGKTSYAGLRHGQTMPNSTGDHPRRPSLRDIARQAKVSAMTVSKALRNAPKISPPTRQRIIRVARNLGYRPDPEMARLMNHVRDRTKRPFQGLICAVTDRQNEPNHPFIRAMIEAAQRRAEAVGFAFSYIHFQEDATHRRRLRRLLWARGARGVIFLPLEQPRDVGSLLPWSELPAVAATSSLLAPDLHRIVPSHYANTLLLCTKLWQRGYRRIGLVIDAGHDSRVNHVFSAAMVWHQYRFAGRVVVPPLIYEQAGPTGLKLWFRRTRPDAVITRDAEHAREFAEALGLELGGPVAFACTYANPASGCAGIDECPGEIAAAAIDRLASMIQHGERGIPAVPTVTLVRGKWLEGPSCPRPRAVPGAVYPRPA